MDRDPRRLSLRWLRSAILGGNRRKKTFDKSPIALVFRLILIISACMIVSAGWYFVDRSQSYQVGYRAPRTYLAQSSTLFVDEEATNKLREMAAARIAGVQVHDEEKTRKIRQRIDDLNNNDNLDFAPLPLVKLVNGYPDAPRRRIIAAAVDIAEKIHDRFINETEQTAMIWSNLSRVSMGQAEKNLVSQILHAMLEPTLIEDNEKANRLRKDVSQQVSPVVRRVSQGSVLVEEGDVVTPGLAEKLRAQGYPDASFPWKQLFFILIVTFAWSNWLIWLSQRLDIKLTNLEWAYAALLLVISWGTQRWLAVWDIDSLSLLALVGWLFLSLSPAFAFHIALGGGLIGYLIAFPGMTSAIAVGCVVSGVAAGSGFFFFREAASRIMIWRNMFGLGFCLTVTSMFIHWGFGLSLSWYQFAVYMFVCALWSSLAVAFLPLWESIFAIISPLRLLEMSHPSQPLLKRLQLEAPGTYHHTVTVSTLAEAVADRLGMNGLLVKTGTYYHDIGKLKRPHYFVENQPFGDNIHDRLAPRESAKIILSHVKDGLELADEYKLPPPIKRFIAEHHGKTCLTYFHKKAVTADKEAGGDGDVSKADFCYPGPTPQSPETALLMLSDSIEAAMKGLNRMCSDRTELEKLVDEVIDSKIMGRQFVDVDFTMREISSIKAAFVEVLVSMYHSREIKPLPKEEEGVKEANAPAV